jgi:hypothetical protein
MQILIQEKEGMGPMNGGEGGNGATGNTILDLQVKLLVAAAAVVEGNNNAGGAGGAGRVIISYIFSTSIDDVDIR